MWINLLFTQRGVKSFQPTEEWARGRAGRDDFSAESAIWTLASSSRLILFCGFVLWVSLRNLARIFGSFSRSALLSPLVANTERKRISQIVKGNHFLNITFSVFYFSSIPDRSQLALHLFRCLTCGATSEKGRTKKDSGDWGQTHWKQLQNMTSFAHTHMGFPWVFH